MLRLNETNESNVLMFVSQKWVTITTDYVAAAQNKHLTVKVSLCGCVQIKSTCDVFIYFLTFYWHFGAFYKQTRRVFHRDNK